MHEVSTVAIYGAAFVLIALVCLAAGVLIAKALTGPEEWTYDEPCEGWVDTPAVEVWHDPDAPVWTPCRNRRPCPIHDTDARRPNRGR